MTSTTPIFEANSSLGPGRVCIRCYRPALRMRSPIRIVCEECAKEYPVIEGVPVLIDDLETHQKAIADSMAGREEWYRGEQVVTPERNVWRHLNHLMNFVISDLYRQHVGLGKEILDLGCGDGRNATFLKTVGARVTGTDYNLLRVARASQHSSHYDSLFMSDLSALPLPDKSWQVIHFDQVLEHIPAPENALKSIHRVLRDDGALLLGIPNEGCWYHQLKFKIKPSLLKETDHVNFFTLKSITTLMGECGFKVVDARGLAWGLPALGRGPLLGTITHADRVLRRHVWYNKLWETAGKVILPGQNFLLYMIAKKIDSRS